jgi:hypothetical protein
MTVNESEDKMRITMIIAVLAVIFAAGLLFETTAQKPIRIQFAKGKNTAVIKATTLPHGTTYILRARSGQKLIINLTPASVLGVKVETVGRYGEMVLLRKEAGGKYEVGLEETGDYTIFVGPLGRNPVTFTLTVTVVKMSDI